MNAPEIARNISPAPRPCVAHPARSEAKSGPRQSTVDYPSDRRNRSHNPKVVGSNPTPATKGNMKYRRKPTSSWAFVLFQPVSTGLSTGLSGLFIGTYSTLAYAAYARVRGASGRHAAPLRQRFGPAWACIGQPYACPMQLPYSTFESGFLSLP